MGKIYFARRKPAVCKIEGEVNDSLSAAAIMAFVTIESRSAEKMNIERRKEGEKYNRREKRRKITNSKLGVTEYTIFRLNYK
jgi:hypothetical protein